VFHPIRVGAEETNLHVVREHAVLGKLAVARRIW